MIIIKRRDKQEMTSKKRIEKIVRQLLIELGENPDREGLADTATTNEQQSIFK